MNIKPVYRLYELEGLEVRTKKRKKRGSQYGWSQALRPGRTSAGAWRRDYNETRPHSSIGNLTPIEFANSVRRTTGWNKAISST